MVAKKSIYHIGFLKIGAMFYCVNRVSSSGRVGIQIVRDVLKEKPSSFREIVERYHSSIFRVCLSHLGSLEEAEDAVQEIFLRVYRSISTLKHNSRLWAWLYSITMNHLKTQYSRLRRLDYLNERTEHNLRFYQNDPAVLVEQKETCNRIQQAVAALPSNLKEVVILYYMKDMSVTDISEALGITRENVKSKLYRARKRLKEILKNYICGSKVLT